MDGQTAGAGAAYEATLDDGTALLFRPIQPHDRRRIAEGFERLSPESRYRRFFHGIDHLSEKDLDYLTEVDRVDHDAWVALLKDVEHQPGVGVARWVRLRDDPATAEAAVTVIDDYQGKGIGKTLLWLTMHGAIEQGIRAIRAVVMAENDGAIALVRGLGAMTGRVQSGLVEATFALPDTVEALDRSPIPLVLRALACGQIAAELQPDGTTRLR